MAFTGGSLAFIVRSLQVQLKKERPPALGVVGAHFQRRLSELYPITWVGEPLTVSKLDSVPVSTAVRTAGRPDSPAVFCCDRFAWPGRRLRARSPTHCQPVDRLAFRGRSPARRVSAGPGSPARHPVGGGWLRTYSQSKLDTVELTAHVLGFRGLSGRTPTNQSSARISQSP